MNRTLLNDRVNPSLLDRKRAIFSAKEFISSVDLVVESSSRSSGTIASFTTLIPFSVRGVFAASLKSFSMPMTFGTNLAVRTFTVTYTNVVSYPGNFTMPIGFYYYSLSQGTVTYAEATAYPSSNNLLYFILNYFSGGLDSLTVNPQTGGINWTWDASTGGVSSSNVPAFFNLLTPLSGLAWISNGKPIDLSGCRDIGLIISDLSSQGSNSNVTRLPNYFDTIPVNVSFGSVLAYEPIREEINWFGSAKDISILNVQVVDAATNILLPLLTDWSMVIRLYVSADQNS
jgi:hypothetical protein